MLSSILIEKSESGVEVVTRFSSFKSGLDGKPTLRIQIYQLKAKSPLGLPLYSFTEPLEVVLGSSKIKYLKSFIRKIEKEADPKGKEGGD